MFTRIQAIRERLQDGEAVLISNPANRFYLTGFHSSAGTLFITQDRACFLIDFRYFEKAKKQIKHCEVLLSNRISAQLKELASNSKTIYLETSFVSLDQFKNYQNIFMGKTVSPEDRLDHEIKKLRSVKSKFEIAHIKKAQKIF